MLHLQCGRALVRISLVHSENKHVQPTRIRLCQRFTCCPLSDELQICVLPDKSSHHATQQWGQIDNENSRDCQSLHPNGLRDGDTAVLDTIWIEWPQYDPRRICPQPRIQ